MLGRDVSSYTLLLLPSAGDSCRRLVIVCLVSMLLPRCPPGLELLGSWSRQSISFCFGAVFVSIWMPQFLMATHVTPG